MKKTDVVVVPDFSGAAAASFEARTLFFLASWIEYSNVARCFPLHLACIGEPPASVKWLAEQADARITVHQSMAAEQRGVANKLRGLEIKGETESVLLLDADILVWGDLSPLADLGNCISAAPAINSVRVPEAFWPRIYSALSVEPPTSDKIADVTKTNWPYYNSGVVFAPWNCHLRSLWETNIRDIARLFENENITHKKSWKSVCASDQAGFAVAVEQLRHDGLPFHSLAAPFHSHFSHLYTRQVSLSETRLFHAITMFRDLKPHQRDLTGDLQSYHKNLCRFLHLKDKTARQSSNPIVTFFKYMCPAVRDARQMHQKLLQLNERYVREALQKNP